ncbi:hypothetical protein D3C71_2070040 [compost metagenome]
MTCGQEELNGFNPSHLRHRYIGHDDIGLVFHCTFNKRLTIAHHVQKIVVFGYEVRDAFCHHAMVISQQH